MSFAEYVLLLSQHYRLLCHRRGGRTFSLLRHSLEEGQVSGLCGSCRLSCVDARVHAAPADLVEASCVSISTEAFASSTVCTVIHVRRGDIVLHEETSRRYRAIAEYVETKEVEIHDNILLLTDDANAIGEAKKLFSEIFPVAEI